MLFQTHSLDLRRKGKGYSTEKGDWVEGEEEKITLLCNWQPYQKGKEQVTLPEGVKTSDAYLAYTRQDVNCADEFSFEAADTVVFESRLFYAKARSRWRNTLGTIGGNYLDHDLVLFIRKPELPEKEELPEEEDGEGEGEGDEPEYYFPEEDYD